MNTDTMLDTDESNKKRALWDNVTKSGNVVYLKKCGLGTG
jgi:hypothetical protein